MTEIYGKNVVYKYFDEVTMYIHIKLWLTYGGLDF